MAFFDRQKADRNRIRNFIILFHPRSGSSWLRSMLAANSQFRVGYELLGKERDPDRQMEIIDRFYAKPSGRKIRAVGFKVAPYQVADFGRFAEKVRELQASLIHISRKNVLKTAISQIRRKELVELSKAQTGEAVHNLRDDIKRPPPSVVDPQVVLTSIRDSSKEKKRLDGLVEMIGTPTKQVYYERLLDDRNGVLDEISGFLDVPIEERDTFMTRKNTPDDIRKAVANYDELEAALADTEFAHLLED